MADWPTPLGVSPAEPRRVGPMLALLPGQLADALGIMRPCPAARCPGDHGRLADALGLPARGTAARRPDARVARPACRRPGDHAPLPGGPLPWGSWPTGRRPGASGPRNRGASAPMLALPASLPTPWGSCASCPAARCPGDHGRLADALGLPARGTAARRPRCSRCPASLPTPRNALSAAKKAETAARR